MKRILLSLSLAALLAVAGGSFAQGDDTDTNNNNTNTMGTTPADQSGNTPNGTPTDNNNNLQTGTTNPSNPNSTPGAGGMAIPVEMQPVQGFTITVNNGTGVPLSYTGTMVNIPQGETLQKVKITSSNGKSVNCTINKINQSGAQSGNQASKIRIVSLDTKTSGADTVLKACKVEVDMGGMSAPGTSAPGAM